MKRKAKESSRPSTEQLGQMLVNIYESGYLDRNKAYKTSFIKGVVGGVGSVIGATLVVALIVWVLSLFNNVPLIGRLVENVRETVNSTTR